MFITVMFGAGCRELVNPWCNLVTLSAHLRRRGGVPPDAPIALLAEDGNLVSLDEGLEEGASPAACMGGSLLQERGTYVLVHIIRGLPGPSRRAALAVRPPSHGQQLQEAHEHSAWPPGARPPFEASEGGLPAIQDPLAGARSQVRWGQGQLGRMCRSGTPLGEQTCGLREADPNANPTLIYPKMENIKMEDGSPSTLLQCQGLRAGMSSVLRHGIGLGTQ
ncbi:uncharacterized protein C22orf15 homolog isoform X4 [Oryctolagus cuniculus]|uniref:uncharacterized protein C22orf15 homolog isoform X4 n=1 Tax=Oryctolagus cuniculus TaxID=9986 RepID=UPI0038796C71